MRAIGTLAFMFCALGIPGAEIPRAPVPPSPYLPIIYKYADAMLERGRDANGLFYSALDRVTMTPLTHRPPAPGSVREEERVGPRGGALVGSNPRHDQNLLRLLYTLSELSGKPKYREAADAELRWFVENSDKRVRSDRPWMLWARCFDLEPDLSRQFVEPGDHNFSGDFPRYAGFYIRSWAVAYARTTNDSFLNAIDNLAMALPLGFHIPPPDAPSRLSLAIDCDAASRIVPEPLASKLRALADEQDRIFCSLPHRLKWAPHPRGGMSAGGFIIGDRILANEDRFTGFWHRSIPNFRYTTPQVGMMCVSRYENSGKVEYRELIHGAADAYLHFAPPPGGDTWPMMYGHAISLQVAAWRSTAQQKYLDRAQELADFAVKRFFDQSPLPRASLKSDHYEAITGADTLALGLVELHLHILGITAVRYPPNTIDR